MILEAEYFVILFILITRLQKLDLSFCLSWTDYADANGGFTVVLSGQWQ